MLTLKKMQMDLILQGCSKNDFMQVFKESSHIHIASKNINTHLSYNKSNIIFFIPAEKRGTANRTTATQASDNISHSPGECR